MHQTIESLTEALWFIEWGTIVLYSTLLSIGGVGVLYIAMLSLIVCWNNCSSSRHPCIILVPPWLPWYLPLLMCSTNVVQATVVLYWQWYMVCPKGVRSTPTTQQRSCGHEAVQEAARLVSCAKPCAFPEPFITMTSKE